MYESGFNYSGHTEFLASLSVNKKKPVMMLVGQNLKTIPLTFVNSFAEGAIISLTFTTTLELSLLYISEIPVLILRPLGSSF